MTSSHFQLYPAQGELMKAGQVWIIESLQESDRHTGLAIRQLLDDLFAARDIKIKVTFRSVTCASELLAALDELESDVKRTCFRGRRSPLPTQRGYLEARCPTASTRGVRLPRTPGFWQVLHSVTTFMAP
jgi:hypothetical protein